MKTVIKSVIMTSRLRRQNSLSRNLAMTGVFSVSVKNLLPFTRGDVRKDRGVIVSARNLLAAANETVYYHLSLRLLRQNFFVRNLAVKGVFLCCITCQVVCFCISQSWVTFANVAFDVLRLLRQNSLSRNPQ
jgi:hypothetical protein